jgi:predicted transposase YbfD/YdcC
MSTNDSSNIIDHFRNIEDPRIERNKKHLVWDIISLTICAVVCGCETWEEIELYGKEKEGWLKTILELPNGIPSHDTIRRLFIRLNPEQMQECFLSWVEAVRKSSEGEIVAIDGKTARRTHDRLNDKGPLHMVSAWSHENRLILGQVKTDEDSNEITAIPKLLQLLELKGSIVTIDAIGTQKEVAEAIVEKHADYVLAVKANRPTLHEEVKWFFDDIDPENDQKEGLIDYYRDVDKDHGRIEIRECICSEEIDWLKPYLEGWPRVKSIAMVKAKRIIGDEESQESRFYVSSLAPDAQLLSKAVRAHWGVENSVHWVLDMVFREDESRMRMGNSPENFAILRRIALNLVRRDVTSKRSLKGRRKICGWNNKYLENLLFAPDEAFQPRDDT